MSFLRRHIGVKLRNVQVFSRVSPFEKGGLRGIFLGIACQIPHVPALPTPLFQRGEIREMFLNLTPMCADRNLVFNALHGTKDWIPFPDQVEDKLCASMTNLNP